MLNNKFFQFYCIDVILKMNTVISLLPKTDKLIFNHSQTLQKKQIIDTIY